MVSNGLLKPSQECVQEALAHEGQMVSNRVLKPSQECVQEALQSARPNTLTPIVSAYFDHSQRTSHLCLALQDSIIHARFLYRDIQNIINCFPLDSDAHFLTESQCHWAFDVFLQFDKLDNPFPQPGSQGLYDLCHCFSELRQQIHHKLRKLHSRIRLLRHATSCSIPCFIGKLSSSFHPSKLTKKELAHLSQLNAADRGTCILHDLNTIDRLVDRLHSSVEGDKFLIRLGLERGRDRYPIQLVVKQLRKNHHYFLVQLLDLEEHLCLCFAAINRTRSLLLEEICTH